MAPVGRKASLPYIHNDDALARRLTQSAGGLIGNLHPRHVILAAPCGYALSPPSIQTAVDLPYDS